MHLLHHFIFSSLKISKWIRKSCLWVSQSIALLIEMEKTRCYAFVIFVYRMVRDCDSWIINLKCYRFNLEIILQAISDILSGYQFRCVPRHFEHKYPIVNSAFSFQRIIFDSLYNISVHPYCWWSDTYDMYKVETVVLKNDVTESHAKRGIILRAGLFNGNFPLFCELKFMLPTWFVWKVMLILLLSPKINL